MAKLREPKRSFFQLAAIVMLTAAASLAALWAPTTRLSHAESDQLLEQGRNTHGADAQTDFKLAVWLNPGNRSAHLELARLQISSGQPDDALDTLVRAGQGSDALRLKIRTLIELSRYNSAADESARLIARTQPPAGDLELSADAFLLAGRTSDAAALPSLAPSPVAVQIQRTVASPLILADSLYAAGLPKSAATLLDSLPPSFDRNLLLARLHYASHSSADLSRAADLLQAAIALSPTSIQARMLLASVFHDQGNSSAEGAQTALIKRLQSGHP